MGQKEDELKKKNKKAIWRGEFILDKVMYRKRQVFLDTFKHVYNISIKNRTIHSRFRVVITLGRDQKQKRTESEIAINILLFSFNLKFLTR